MLAGQRLLLPCSLFACFCLLTAALANDGGIAFGGSPKLLKDHPSVTMQSEVVRITVGEEKVTVDCQFVFENKGPACSVRMGFPDQGLGESNPDEEDAEMKKPPRSTFTRFQSWIDGKPVKTQLVRADQPGKFWHAKVVSFPANSRHLVHDRYETHVGAQITPINSNVRQASYVLHTGASWHGSIGRTEVQIAFQRKRMTSPLKPIPMKSSEQESILQKDWSKQRNVIYYRGPVKPTVEGKTLRFVRTDWEPTASDDIYLYFDNIKY